MVAMLASQYSINFFVHRIILHKSVTSLVFIDSRLVNFKVGSKVSNISQVWIYRYID